MSAINGRRLVQEILMRPVVSPEDVVIARNLNDGPLSLLLLLKLPGLGTAGSEHRLELRVSASGQVSADITEWRPDAMREFLRSNHFNDRVISVESRPRVGDWLASGGLKT